MKRKPTIRIYDSKGGKFRVKLYGKNGEQLSTTEPLDTHANVIKNINAQSKAYSYGSDSCVKWNRYWTPTDHTKTQHFAKKYGWESGKQVKTK